MINSIYWVFSDMRAMVWRNLKHIFRLPQLIVFSTIQPIMFMLIFTYVFGGAIKTSVPNYILYLLPGIILQTVLFGSMQTGMSLAQDMGKGMMDRFRSLPMSPSAILMGRTATDIIRNFFVVILMLAVGFIIGFRVEHGLLSFAGAMLMTLLFGFIFSWVSAAIGLAVKNVETAQVAGFIWVFPLVFASSIFVPVNTMPDWLQVFANNTPVTATVDVVRALLLGQPYGDFLARSLAWMGGLLVIFIPLSIWTYKRNY